MLFDFGALDVWLFFGQHGFDQENSTRPDTGIFAASPPRVRVRVPSSDSTVWRGQGLGAFAFEMFVKTVQKRP